ncbi:MAG: hypothetical protein FWE67_03960 [Planctomycetaceae bacterium]|nr:hypothetical protein [Planctomycetaceae bacterium]
MEKLKPLLPEPSRSNKGGQTGLPFAVKWQPGSGSITEGDDCGCGSYTGFNYSAPGASVSMSTQTYDDETYEYANIWHSKAWYSSYAPSSNVPNGGTPSSSSEVGYIDSLVLRIVTEGNPNFGNYAYIDVDAYLPKPPEVTASISDPPAGGDIFGVSSPNVSITGAFFDSLWNGIKNVTCGAVAMPYNVVKEIALQATDIAMLSIDTIATFAGNPLDWEEMSAHGQTTKNQTAGEIALGHGRAALCAVTLGVSEQVIATSTYINDGEIDKFQQTMGAISAGQILSAAILKAATPKSQKTFAEQMSPEEAAKYNAYWEHLTKNAPEKAPPYAIIPKYNANGSIKSYTTYDSNGFRAYQYEIQGRHGEGYHIYDQRPPLGASGKGRRSVHYSYDFFD